MEAPRIYTPNTKHLYEISFADAEGKHAGTVQVEANNRSQATRLAEKNGYAVRDINMVG